VEDPRDQESGEDEEQVDANPRRLAQAEQVMVDPYLWQHAAVDDEVVIQDQRYGQPADAVQHGLAAGGRGALRLLRRSAGLDGHGAC